MLACAVKRWEPAQTPFARPTLLCPPRSSTISCVTHGTATKCRIRQLRPLGSTAFSGNSASEDLPAERPQRSIGCVARADAGLAYRRRSSCLAWTAASLMSTRGVFAIAHVRRSRAKENETCDSPYLRLRCSCTRSSPPSCSHWPVPHLASHASSFPNRLEGRTG